MFSDVTIELARNLIDKCRLRGIRVVTAESCTGGLIASALTDISGSSDVFDRGFITYSNLSKTQQLGIPREMLHSKGAVSSAVAMQMAVGALHRSGADLAISTTGIAGPTGGTSEKPVGMVFMAVEHKYGPGIIREFRFHGSRRTIRQSAVREALRLMLSVI